MASNDVMSSTEGGSGAGGRGGGSLGVPGGAPGPSAVHTSGLYHFLLQFRVEKGSEFTHTSFARPTGAFYIPGQRFDEFMQLYRAAISLGEDVYLTEKHRPIGPVVVDLDFRFDLPSVLPAAAPALAPALAPGPAALAAAGTAPLQAPPDVEPTAEAARTPAAEPPARLYTDAHVHAFALLYARELAKYVTKEAFDIYILEKPCPSVIKNVVKDGLHLQVPDVVTRPIVQQLVRREVLKGMPAALADLPLTNRFEDVLDEAVIERNNWLMYMSKKPGGMPYKVTKVLAYHVADDKLLDVTLERLGLAMTPGALTERLAIRNKFEETPLHPDRCNDVLDWERQAEERRQRAEIIRSVMRTQPTDAHNVCDSLDTVHKLVDILDAARGESYNDWIRVGWCLRNIDHRLLDKWIEFSKRSPKYIEGECARMWSHMRTGGLGMGTLHLWARKDSPERYREIVRSDLTELIRKSVSGTHYDVARVVHHMYRYQYVCASLRNRVWYEFRDHRWHYSDSAISLRRHISEAVSDEYLQVALSHQKRAATTSGDDEKKSNTEMCNKLNALAMKLKTTTFKDNIIKECCEMFYHEKFEEKLDSNCGLLGFLNGVYDLENMEFREGRPDDFISYTTGINYVPFSEELPFLPDIRRFWAQVLPKDDIREYVITLLASFLSGHTREERFHIWTGVGSNGKSLSIELFDRAMGDYSCKFPVTLLTQKRAASNAATSEVARAKGRRFACLQEPSEDERLNIGLLKELTGGDKVQARAIYKEPVEFKPQWHIALLCNHLPNVPSDDGGTWRRIRVVEFTSRFTERPIAPNEFPIDLELSQKLDDWKEPFMSMLIEIYRTRYAKSKIKEPEDVLAATREYQKNNDHFADFIDTCLERAPSDAGGIYLSEAFTELKAWIKEDNIPIRGVTRKELQKYLDRALGKPASQRGDQLYSGYRVKERGRHADENF